VPGLSSRAYRSSNRKSWTQLAGQVCVIERNLDRDSLYHLGEITGRVVGRQQRKLRSAGRRNLNDLATDDLSGIFVDTQLCEIADFDMG